MTLQDKSIDIEREEEGDESGKPFLCELKGVEKG
jgi:hypothetical protein